MKQNSCIIYLFLIIYCMPIPGYSDYGTEQVSLMLTEVVKSEGTEYISVRDEVVTRGKDAIPALQEIAVDMNRDWRERLAARICLERILRLDDINSFRKFNWTEIN